MITRHASFDSGRCEGAGSRQHVTGPEFPLIHHRARLERAAFAIHAGPAGNVRLGTCIGGIRSSTLNQTPLSIVPRGRAPAARAVPQLGTAAQHLLLDHAEVEAHRTRMTASTGDYLSRGTQEAPAEPPEPAPALDPDLLRACLPALCLPEMADLPKPSVTARHRLHRIAEPVRNNPNVMDIAAEELHAAADECVRRGRLLTPPRTPKNEHRNTLTTVAEDRTPRQHPGTPPPSSPPASPSPTRPQPLLLGPSPRHSLYRHQHQLPVAEEPLTRSRHSATVPPPRCRICRHPHRTPPAGHPPAAGPGSRLRQERRAAAARLGCATEQVGPCASYQELVHRYGPGGNPVRARNLIRAGHDG